MSDKVNDKVNGKLYEVVNGWIRFRFTYGGKRHTFHPHIPECDIATADTIEQIIRNDIGSNSFDWSLSRYRISPKKCDTITLWECWQTFLAQYDDGNQSNATAKKRRLTTEHLESFKGDDRDLQTTFDAFQRYCNSTMSESYALQFLNQVRSAVKIVEHVDLELARKKKKRQSSIIDVYPAGELRLLLRLVEDSDLSRDEKGFIFSLAYTGMRPGEVAGLNVEHWDSEHSLISIKQSWDGKSIKPTKTLKNRIVKVNLILGEILNQQCKDKDTSKPIFQGRKSYRFPYSEFVRSIWKPLSERAIDQGLIHHYRNPYQLRHTFASLALAKGEPLEQVASHLGNSPSVCRQHYAGFQPSNILITL